MALTVGTGPFGHTPAGRFNFDVPAKGVLLIEDSPRRVRGVLGGEVVVDSKRVKLLHESGHLPVWYFPEEDVRAELLRRSEKTTRCPWKGETVYFSVEADGRVSEDAAWSYREPLPGAAAIAGMLAFHFDALDEWLEEDEPVLGHPRDPYHRIDVHRTSRHVRVLVDGHVVADTTRARALFEAGLPTRWYIPREDVRMDLLSSSDTRTTCAYKGYASYWSLTGQEDIVWSYEDPLHDATRVGGYLAFFNERVDIELDGERQERPVTQWSRRQR
jgi:uncharacterized protein (DUF427 family)